MEALAERISKMMVRAGITQDDDAEVVAYGLFVIMSGAVQISLLLLISLILGIVPAMAAFVLPYSLLKRTIGGWHAKTHAACLAGYTSLATVFACAGWYTPQALTRPATFLFGAFMVATIWLRAPVGHPNNPQRPAQMLRYKRIGRAVATAEWLVLTGLAVIGGSPGLNSLALCGALGGAVAAVTLLIPMGSSAEKGGEST